MHNEPLSNLSPIVPSPGYYQLVHTLNRDLPPPLDDTPEALLARNDAAIAQISALMPVNANEVALAAQCVVTRAQADDTLRLLRQHADDITMVMKLNAQYVAMVRASLGAHGHLLRVQTLRHKREASDASLKADEWAQHIAFRSMQQALEAGGVAVTPAVPIPAAEQLPAPAIVAVRPPAALADPPAVAMPVATRMQPPAPPAPAAEPSRPRHTAIPAEADDPERDLAAEADDYALIYPRRAREMRRHGGLPPDCSFGPPDDDLVHAVATGISPVLRALDDQDAVVR